MNFLLYKAFYKKTLVASLLFLSLALGFFRCVGIEDLLPPTIGNFTLQANYNVTDTIFIDANLFDNFALGKVSVDIEPLDPNGSFSFNKVIRDNVGAKRLNLERYEVVVIPANATLGEYKMTLTVTDVLTDSTLKKEANKKIIEQNFMVGGDNEEPNVGDVNIELNSNININLNIGNLMITKLEDSSYQVCRSSTIPIAGTASDNVGIKSIVAQFEGFPTNDSRYRREFGFTTPNPLEIDLEFVFEQNPIKIPLEYQDNTPILNGDRLNLVITVTDINGRFASKTIPFLVDCDDQSPIIERLITTPASNVANDSIKVIEGQELFITGGRVKDRLGVLKDVFVYFDGNLIPSASLENIRDTIFTIATSTNPILVPIPSNATKDDFYKIRIVATDSAGNAPTIKEVIVDIVENEVPEIKHTGIDVDGSPIENYQTSTPNNQIVVSAGVTIRLYGKVTDDLALQFYQIRWREVNGNGSNDVTLEGNTDSFESIGSINVISNVRVPTSYTLTIYAIDILGLENQITYYFRVQ